MTSPPIVARVVAAGMLCLATGQVALAASPLAYVTPAAIGAKITGVVPQIPTDNTSAPSHITATVCHGVGTAHAGKFNTFRCKSTWENGTATVWARALSGGKWCASSTGLAACPATPPIGGDPRICSLAPAPPTADPNRCALGATEFAIIRAMPVNFDDAGWTIRNVACKGSNLSHNCSFSSHSAYGTYYQGAVSFAVVDGVWTATIAVTGGGGTATCTVQPGPPANGSPWAAGPTPTCSH